MWTITKTSTTSRIGRQRHNSFNQRRWRRYRRRQSSTATTTAVTKPVAVICSTMSSKTWDLITCTVIRAKHSNMDCRVMTSSSSTSRSSSSGIDKKLFRQWQRRQQRTTLTYEWTGEWSEEVISQLLSWKGQAVKEQLKEFAILGNCLSKLKVNCGMFKLTDLMFIMFQTMLLRSSIIGFWRGLICLFQIYLCFPISKIVDSTFKLRLLDLQTMRMLQ